MERLLDRASHIYHRLFGSTKLRAYESVCLEAWRGGGWGCITDPPGMLQLGARFYWPQLGRFISSCLRQIRRGGQDPIGDGMNWYAYAGNNPVVWVDPAGLAYDDHSITVGLPWVGPIVGVQIGPDPCASEKPWKWWAASTWRNVHPYVGGGLMTPGPGYGRMHGVGDPGTKGLNWALAAGWGVGASYGGGPLFSPDYIPFYEEGAPVWPGASLTAYYSW